MWTKIKSWFKKEKVTDVADRVEPVLKLKQPVRVGKSSQVSTKPSYTAPQQVDTSFQDLALTYLVLDCFSDSATSAVDSKPVTFSVPEPTHSYTSESSTSSYSSYDESNSRYSSSSSDYGSSSSSDYSSSSDSSSSYSSD